MAEHWPDLEENSWIPQKFCTHPDGPRSVDGGYPQVINETPTWCPISPTDEAPRSV